MLVVVVLVLHCTASTSTQPAGQLEQQQRQQQRRRIHKLGTVCGDRFMECLEGAQWRRTLWRNEARTMGPMAAQNKDGMSKQSEYPLEGR
uniref:Putative secreted peptide n=1 Tax=Anopheles braziliensis TaxID=58242 RepID=A0A2M3ZVK4_9DIPT